MGLLLFGGQTDKDTDELILCASTIAHCYGKSKEQAAHNYAAGDDLARFIDEVLPELEIRPYSESQRRCRRAVDAAFPNPVRRALEAELCHPLGEDAVYFDTGRVYSEPQRRKDRRRAEDRVAEGVRRAGVPTQQRILKYMNGIPPNRLQRLVNQNLPDAYAAARAIEDPGKRMTELRKLRHIEVHPKPLYRATENRRTVRIYEAGDGLTFLHTPLRKILLRGTTEFDLVSAQFAINVKLWHVPVVVEYLEQGGQIWNDLLSALGLAHLERGTPEYAEAKGALKVAVYSLLYGAQLSPIVNGYRKHGHQQPGLKASLVKFGASEVYERFTGHPIIRAMYEAREGRLKEVRAEGIVTDAFGRQIEVRSHDDAKSALAQQAQAVEMQLLAPLFDYAEESDDFKVVLWQHDGFSVHFTREARRERETRRIMEIVNAEAERLGIPTHLEAEPI